MAKCCAPHCLNNQKRDSSEFSFHGFPENSSLRAKWVENIGRSNWTPGRRSLLCSAHFEKCTLVRKGNVVAVCEGAVPTIFSCDAKKRGNQKFVKTAKSNLEGNKSQVPSPGGSHGIAAENSGDISPKNIPPEDMVPPIVKNAPLEETVPQIAESGKKNGAPELKEIGLTINNESTHSVRDLLLKDSSHPNDSVASQDSFIISKMPDSLLLVNEGVTHKVVPNISQIATPIDQDFLSTSQTSIELPPLVPISISRGKQVSSQVSDRTPLANSQVFGAVADVEKRAVKRGTTEENLLGTKPTKYFNSVCVPSLSSASCKGFIPKENEAYKCQNGTWMCRLCGSACDNTINLFGKEASRLRLLERISSILSINVAKEDGLPQSICSSCLSKLDACSQLIATSISTQKQLATIMGKVTDSSDNGNAMVYNQVSSISVLENKSQRRKVLLMELSYDGEKTVEECLHLAGDDLHRRINPQTVCSEPRFNLVVVTLNENCKLSHLEQVCKAAETLFYKDLPPDTSLLRREKQTELAEVSYGGGMQEGEEPVVSNTSERMLRLKELQETLNPDPDEPLVMPICDDISPFEFFEIRNPSIKKRWQGKEVTVTNMQKIFEWQESDGVGSQLVCRLCSHRISRTETPLSHLRRHSDLSCCDCLKIFPSLQEMDAHKCGNKTSRRILRSQQSSSQRTRKSVTKKYSYLWYQCSFCVFRTKAKSVLEQHLQQHYQANAKCQGCGFDAANVQEAVAHRVTCTLIPKLKEWRCRRCMEVFESEEQLDSHIREQGHKNLPAVWLCDICGKRFPNGSKLRVHKKIHLPEEFKYLHHCPQCPKRYINSTRLKEHMQKHEDKKYMCKVCGKMFSTRPILRQHELTHGEAQFLCSLCSRTFHRKSHLLKHMKVHDPNNPRRKRPDTQCNRDGLNRCRECKEVIEAGKLLMHYKNSHPTLELHNYSCDICLQENTSYAELFQHQREMHRAGITECPFCEKTIEGSTRMKYHLMKHEDMFPYYCPHCSKGCSSNSMLQDHIRRKHTGEKPFLCALCPKRFATSGALTQHNTVHSLPHQLLPCPVCNQGFKRKAHLSVHMRTHTGEKPYACPICERPFRQRPDTLKHIKTIHGEDPSRFLIRFNPNTGHKVISVTDMELVLEGEDLMQASL